MTPPEHPDRPRQPRPLTIALTLATIGLAARSGEHDGKTNPPPDVTSRSPSPDPANEWIGAAPTLGR